MTITKHTGSGPPQRLPMSPAKPFNSSKLRIGGSDSEGRCGAFREKAHENAHTKDITKLADTGEHGHGK
jgi:hypothetical protein